MILVHGYEQDEVFWSFPTSVRCTLMCHLALTYTETRMRLSRPVGRFRQGNISVGESKWGPLIGKGPFTRCTSKTFSSVKGSTSLPRSSSWRGALMRTGTASRFAVLPFYSHAVHKNRFILQRVAVYRRRSRSNCGV
jgi:hypothetical protein